jgi:RNA polymerase sigma-70 factor (ECF subfamily)
MATDLTDGELVTQIGPANNPAAEAEFVRRLAPRVRLYGLRHLRCPHAAEDLTQHVLLTALQALREKRLRDPEKLASFVLGMCRMATLDLRRNAQRKDRLNEKFASTLRLPDQPTPEPLDRDQLARCLQALKERDRTVIVMTFYDDRTAADVSSFLGLTDTNVRVIRHRAIQQLRQCMGAEL